MMPVGFSTPLTNKQPEVGWDADDVLSPDGLAWMIRGNRSVALSEDNRHFLGRSRLPSLQQGGALR